jgi:glyoxylase-like metal-dependent hydrolase (beta-lactamase superfamily II)
MTDDGIHWVEDSYTNYFLVEGDDGRVSVVDAGHPSSWGSFEDALRRIGKTTDDVDSIVLTHGHFDHVGFSERARRDLGIPVYVHENDVPLTKHPWRYDHERPRSLYFATQLQALPIVAAYVRSGSFWAPPVSEVERFSNGSLPVAGSPRVIPTPGHTHGHVALHFPDRDAVIVGDAFVTLDPYTALRGPRVVARAATADSERALATLDKLAETSAHTAYVGHGEPWTGGVEAACEQAKLAGVA